MGDRSVDDYVRKVASALVERDVIPCVEAMRPYLGNEWADRQTAFARRFARM